MHPPKNKRVVTPTVEWITSAAKALPDDDVCAASIRLTLTAMDLLRDQAGGKIISGPTWDTLIHQGGNQSLGDTLGAEGYGLSKNSKNKYDKPPGGFTRALTEACFRIPPGYSWQPALIEEWCHAAAKATAERPTKAKRPAKAAKKATPAVLAEAHALMRIAFLDALEVSHLLRQELPENPRVADLAARLDRAAEKITQGISQAIAQKEAEITQIQEELDQAKEEESGGTAAESAPATMEATPAPSAEIAPPAGSAPVAAVAPAAAPAEVVDDAELATAITSQVATGLNAYAEALSAYEEAMSAYVEARKEGKPFYEEARTAYWAYDEVRKLWETNEEVRKEGKMFEIWFIDGHPIEPIDLLTDSLIDPTDDLEETPTTPQSTTAAPPVGDLDAFLNSLTD